ncbi:hypothetical protein BJX76DRAFT_61102 [Aspergillus varians]
MPSFLDLPAELHGLIIAEVLFGVCPPPAEPARTNRTIFQDLNFKAWGRRRIYQEQRSTHSPSNGFALLLTSRLISAETQAILQRPGSIQYHLDISMLNEVELFATWLGVPQITTRVSTVYASVRLFGHIISYAAARSQSGDGGHLGFHWSFYALLERLLAYGPVDEKVGREKPNSWTNPTYTDREVTIDTVVLDFSSAERELSFPPSEVDYQWWWRQHCAMIRPSADGVDLPEYKGRPDWVARRLTDELRGLLALTNHTASYGAILYERIGTIRVLVDGEVYRELDLNEELAELGEMGKERSVRELQAIREERFAERGDQSSSI